MSGNLVDSEGFPIAGIDIFAVRTQRQRFAVLKTDHKTVSDEIEKLLHIALARPDGEAEIETNGASASEPAITYELPPEIPAEPQPEVAPPSTTAPPQEPRRLPFAVVDIVSPNSPAALADLRVGDEIVSFGDVSLRGYDTPQLTMAALPALLQRHEGQPLTVQVQRSGGNAPSGLVPLSLTPARWSGRGLLGCHIIPAVVSQVDQRYSPEVATAVARRAGSSNI